MFRKLRNRFLILNMAITSLVVLAAFFAVYMTTYNSIQAENQSKLAQISTPPSLTVGGVVQSPSDVGAVQGDIQVAQSMVTQIISTDYALSFVVEVDEAGEVLAIESFIDMPLESYEKAAKAAYESRNGDTTIRLGGRFWQFSVSPSEMHILSQFGAQAITRSDRFRIAFLDITDSQSTLHNLLATFLWVGAVMLVVIYLVSRYFANRSIKPISSAWEKQRQFVADASHELKTPLSVITANRDALLANEDETIKSQREWLDYMKIGIDRMGKLIAELLSLAKIEGADDSQLHKEEFDISAAIKNEMHAMEHSARQRGIATTASIQPDLVVNSNEADILRVFAILFDNAVKYAEENGSIDVVLSKSKRRVSCSVKNTGTGIAPHDIDKVFDRFYQSDMSRTGENGGFGLGLPIAKALVDRLGGKLVVQSEENAATTFAFMV